MCTLLRKKYTLLTFDDGIILPRFMFGIEKYKKLSVGKTPWVNFDADIYCNYYVSGIREWIRKKSGSFNCAFINKIFLKSKSVSHDPTKFGVDSHCHCVSGEKMGLVC